VFTAVTSIIAITKPMASVISINKGGTWRVGAEAAVPVVDWNVMAVPSE
jgi:hypothetical protein